MGPVSDRIFDELREAIEKAEERFGRERWSCHAAVELIDGLDLVYCKHGGRWGFYIETEDEIRPLNTSSIRLRIEASKKLDELWKALIVSKAEQDQELRRSIERFKQFKQ